MRQHDHGTSHRRDVVVGTIGGHPVRFSAGHRVGNDSTAVLALAVSLPVSFDDIAAALWAATRNGLWQTDMADDPEAIHAVVAYMVVNHNTDVADARRELADLPGGSPEWETSIGLRMAAVRAYGTAPPADYPDMPANGPANGRANGLGNGRRGLRIVPD